MMLYGKMGIGMMELQNAMLAVQDNTTVKELTKVMGDDSVSLSLIHISEPTRP